MLSFLSFWSDHVRSLFMGSFLSLCLDSLWRWWPLCKYLFILFMFLPIDGMDWCFPFDWGFISRHRYTRHGLQRHSIRYLKKLTWKAICFFDNYFFCTFGFDHHMYTYMQQLTQDTKESNKSHKCNQISHRRSSVH